MNEFSPKAETNDMELPRTMVRSLRSLFLHLGAMPLSAPRRRHSSSPNCATPGYIYFLVCFLLIIFLLSVRGASLRNIVA